MEEKFSLREFINTKTVDSVTADLVNREIKTRKSMKISQRKLAKLSHVSYASIRRFETTGEISLKSLIRIAEVLHCLEDFELLFEYPSIVNLKDYL